MNYSKIIGGLLVSCVIVFSGQKAIAVDRGEALRGCFGTYDGAPKLANGHVDQQKLMAELLDIHANTYHWVFLSKQSEFEDFRSFLPLAREKQIRSEER